MHRPTALTLLALALTAQATQLFSNKGTLSGWDSTNVEHNGYLGEVSNIYYEGPNALKMTQTYDSNYHDRYHSEVIHLDGYTRGDTRFYGFAFRLASDWSFDAQNYNIAQFIADFTSQSGHCDDWMPTSMIWINGDKISSIDVYFGATYQDGGFVKQPMSSS